MKNIKIKILISKIVFVSMTMSAQHIQWNLALESDLDRFFGFHILETDSFYYVTGTSVAQFGGIEQGFSVSKVSKKDASVVATIHYDEPAVQYDFNNCRKGFLQSDFIIFPQTTITLPASVQVFKVNIHTLDIEKILTILPPDPTSKYTMFLNDFIQINDDYYTAMDYSIGEFNTPSFKNTRFISKFNIKTNKHNYFYLPPLNKLSNLRMAPFNNGILIFALLVGDTVATGKLVVFFSDLDGQILWEYVTPGLSPIYYVSDVYPINDKEVLLASYDSFFSYADFQVYSRWTVTRYDVDNKKIVWSTFWNEPRKPNIRASAKIIQAKNENEFILMANDIDATEDGIGKAVKFNSLGQRIWQKTYDFTTNQGFNNFHFGINTSDGNYLFVGRIFSSKLPQTPWLIKIDEDGNILPIDTTTSTIDTDISHQIPEIKVYPNPASHAIIINQGEITNMTYRLIDMTGAIVKSIPLPHAHHHVVWDISEVPSGTYVLAMLQSGKVVGTKQVLVVR